jgi:hypothetical protein
MLILAIDLAKTKSLPDMLDLASRGGQKDSDCVADSEIFSPPEDAQPP